MASSYYFGDMSITPPANQKPNITIYPTKSDHPHAIDLICHGDSGGPLIFRAGGNNSTNQDILLGLISATQYTAMDIHSVKDLVLQFNYAGEMSKNVGGTLYIEEDMFKFNCKNLTTTEQQILRDRKFYANWVTANVWYYRPWIDAAKQSLTLGHHSPSSACSSQEKASVILDR